MFAYDANQQAYIADVKAGTYAQLVEAAENCQVSVIHPGKPRNKDEPGLEDLMSAPKRSPDRRDLASPPGPSVGTRPRLSWLGSGKEKGQSELALFVARNLIQGRQPWSIRI